MKHDRAARQLPALLAGELSGERRAELDEHLRRCPECREWAATYGFLAGALEGGLVADHPSSEQMAQLAVDPELLTSPERERLLSHLEECAGCRQELEATREALDGARPAAAVVHLGRSWMPRPAALRAALAAGLILALAVTLAVVRRDGGPEPAVVQAAPAAPPEPLEPAAVVAGEPDRQVAGEQLSGRRLIEAPRVLTASSVALASGSDITLRAGEMVVLRDGFSAGAEATLGVEIVPAAGPAKPGSPS